MAALRQSKIYTPQITSVLWATRSLVFEDGNFLYQVAVSWLGRSRGRGQHEH